jgi:hypothetical protein
VEEQRLPLQLHPLPLAACHTRLPCLQEFINYFFLQRAATGAADGGAEWRLQAQARRHCI